jgi:hypothetical protein
MIQTTGYFKRLGDNIRQSKVMQSAHKVSPWTIAGAGAVIALGAYAAHKTSQVSTRPNFTPVTPAKPDFTVKQPNIPGQNINFFG